MWQMCYRAPPRPVWSREYNVENKMKIAEFEKELDWCMGAQKEDNGTN